MMTDTVATGNELWELLHLVLPRYLRITVKHSTANTTTSSSISLGVDHIIRQLQGDNPNVVILQVPWLPSFVALPGYVAVSSLILPAGQGVSIFPMDLASGIPPQILAGGPDNISSPPQKVLDLCCCPGGKFLTLSDFLSPEAIIVGVDISMQRMYTTKNLVHKYLNDVYAMNNVPPRMLLFCSDGTTFSSAMSGDLLYDSSVGLDEIRSSGYKRKRNKSMRGREERRLKAVRNELAIAATATLTPTSAAVTADTDTYTDMRGGRGRERGTTTAEGKEVVIAPTTERSTTTATTVFDKYDAVLVDAQCTHDSSYRHLRYVGDGSTQDINSGKDDDNVWGNTCRSHKHIDSVASDNSVYALQRRLLANGFASLVDGGELVYSTCSAELEQNEHVVEWLLEQEKGRVELVSVAETWCQGSSRCNEYLVGKEENTDLKHLVRMLAQEPINYPALLDFLRLMHATPVTHMDTDADTGTGTGTGTDTETNAATSSQQRLILLADEMCRYSASFSAPPGREGGLAGTVYFGMWAGTSGLFLSRIRKIKKKEEEDFII